MLNVRVTGLEAEMGRLLYISDLPAHGFTERFADLVQAGFPQAGSYMGPKANIGL